MKYNGENFWKNYMAQWFGKELINKWEKYVERKQIDSVNGKINIEIYRNADPKKPTIVFSHGIAGYARLLTPFYKYEKPVLVCQPDDDKMTPAYYTKKVFEKLKSKNKKYIRFEGAHFPPDKESYIRWGEEVDKFIKENN